MWRADGEAGCGGFQCSYIETVPNQKETFQPAALCSRRSQPLPSYHFLPFFSAIERRNLPVLSAKFKIPKSGLCFPLCFIGLSFTITTGKKRSNRVPNPP